MTHFIPIIFLFFSFSRFLKAPKDRRASIGHYTQMVWAETTAIGCAAIGYTDDDDPSPEMPHRIFYVCNYSPPGNYLGQRVYQADYSSSNCPLYDMEMVNWIWMESVGRLPFFWCFERQMCRPSEPVICIRNKRGRISRSVELPDEIFIDSKLKTCQFFFSSRNL